MVRVQVGKRWHSRVVYLGRIYLSTCTFKGVESTKDSVVPRAGYQGHWYRAQAERSPGGGGGTGP